MEEAARFPQATLTGIQFGLASSREISKVSVYGMSSIQHSTQLVSARLGLPVKSGKCETCGTEKPDECDGHFGHIRLPTPIYHPSHVEELRRILSKICLNCFRLKGKKEHQDAGNPVLEVECNGVTFKIPKDSRVSKNLRAAEDSCNFVSPQSSLGGKNKDFQKQKQIKVTNNPKMKGPSHVASHFPSLADKYETFDKKSRGETSKISKTAKQESAGFPSSIPSMADYVAFDKESRGENSKKTKTGKEPAAFASSFHSTPNYVAFDKQSRGENSANTKAAKVTMTTKKAKVIFISK